MPPVEDVSDCKAAPAPRPESIAIAATKDDKLLLETIRRLRLRAGNTKDAGKEHSADQSNPCENFSCTDGMNSDTGARSSDASTASAEMLPSQLGPPPGLEDLEIDMLDEDRDFYQPGATKLPSAIRYGSLELDAGPTALLGNEAQRSPPATSLAEPKVAEEPPPRQKLRSSALPFVAQFGQRAPGCAMWHLPRQLPPHVLMALHAASIGAPQQPPAAPWQSVRLDDATARRCGTGGGPALSEWHGGESLRVHLQELQGKDHRRVLIVRKIQRLGFNSPGKLKAHFEWYGSVERVLVSHSQVHSNRRVPTTRTRPAHLGFIVMQEVSAADAALAHGPRHSLEGIEIEVMSFKPNAREEAEEAEAEDRDPRAAAAPTAEEKEKEPSEAKTVN